MQYDLAVIGCGSVGAAAGYYAALSGLRVLMFDSYTPPHCHGSHHGDTRIIRHAYGEGEKYVPLVLRAQHLWKNLEEVSTVQLFHRSGVLNIGPATSEFMVNVENSAKQYQLNVEKMDARQLQQRWPEWSVPENYIGILESNAGYLKSELAVGLLNKKAAEAGADLHFNCCVNAIVPEQDGVKISTTDGEFSARRVAVTAGTWAKTLLPELPMTPMRKVFSWYQADERYSETNNFPAFIVETPDGDQFYGFPFHNDGLKLGKHNGGQPITAPDQRLPFGLNTQDASEVSGFLRRFLPGVGLCLHGEACTYDVSPDEDFIIDTLPDAPQISVVTGLSGHGFKFATVLGEIIALQAAGQPIPFDLSAFRLNRF